MSPIRQEKVSPIRPVTHGTIGRAWQLCAIAIALAVVSTAALSVVLRGDGA